MKRKAELIKIKLRCPDCKHDNEAYKQNQYTGPSFLTPNDNIVCEGCGAKWIQIFYIKLFPYPMPKLPYYAHRIEDSWRHVFSSSGQVTMCGKENVVPVTVEINQDYGEYHGWLDTQGRVSMIYKDERSLNLCFTYGMTEAIKKGNGIPIKLKITEGHN